MCLTEEAVADNCSSNASWFTKRETIQE